MTKTIIVNVDKIVSKSGMSKLKFAEMVGMRANTLCDYTKNGGIGIDKISLKNLAKIADVMEIDDISELLSIEDE